MRRHINRGTVKQLSFEYSFITFFHTQACIKALKQANEAGVKGVKIVTDSKFTISCATEWVFKWQRNGWKLGNGKPVLHKADIERLVAELATPGLHVSWVSNPSHCKIRLPPYKKN